MPVQVTMPLLTRITQESLEEDYRHVAAQRERQLAETDRAPVAGAPPARDGGRRWSLTAVVVAVFGVLVAVAAVQASRTAPIRAASKEVLIQRIDAQQKVVSGLHRQIGKVSDDNTTLDSDLSTLDQSLSRLTGRDNTLLARTGFGPVSGQGVRVTVDDAPGGTEENGGLVQDRDLRAAFDGLWAAGATAIAVNGQRVTPLSAPRNTGDVIRINGVSLSAPYEVEALGDTKTLQARFIRTSSGSRFTNVTGELHMPVTIENVGHLELPAAPSGLLRLRYAQPLTTAKPPAPNAQEH